MSALYDCAVQHQRAEPIRYGFLHRTFYWLIDIDEPPRLPWWLRPFATFPRGVRQETGLDDAHVFLLTQAKVLGYAFNPLNVYWCFDGTGQLKRVVAEVHNTYGQRHRYVLEPQGDGSFGTPKRFYVSPFFEVAGAYRMRLPFPDEKLDLRIGLYLPGAKPFHATLAGSRLPATNRNLTRMLMRYPLSTLMISALIRLHGIRLYLRGLRVVPRPTAGPR